MREPLSIAEKQLRACFLDQYDLIPVTLDFLPLGLDSYARVYRVVSEQGTASLLKVTSGPLYEPRCLVPRYLKDQGMTSVVAPIPTRSGALWTHLEEWTVTVYPFLDGETSWTGMTDEQWKEVGTIFQQIHQVMLSFDLISGAFLPDIMPTLGLASAFRRFSCSFLPHNVPRHCSSSFSPVCAQDGTPTLSHNMARVHQEPLLERPSNHADGRSQK